MVLPWEELRNPVLYLWIFVHCGMDTYVWTKHAEWKMKYYSLSKQKVLGIIRRPERVERGIVTDTIAVMQPVSPKLVDGKKMWKQEIWSMYQMKKPRSSKQLKQDQVNAKLERVRAVLNGGRQIRIISAWRYPGMSPKNRALPEAIVREIEEALQK